MGVPRSLNNVASNDPFLSLQNPAGFGVVFSRRNQPRIIELGLRVAFQLLPLEVGLLRPLSSCPTIRTAPGTFSCTIATPTKTASSMSQGVCPPSDSRWPPMGTRPIPTVSTDASLLAAWNPAGPNTLTVTVSGSTFNVAIGYIRAELKTATTFAVVAVFDAAGGDASSRNLCQGFVWNHQQDTFSTTLE